jgi:Fe-Mn family superoxide dismutase
MMMMIGTEFQDDNIYRIIMKTAQIPSHALLFNYASQSWNLDFFLQSLVSLNKVRC